MSNSIISELRFLKDEKYADFQRKLLPSILPERIIGVRTPALRKIAKEIYSKGKKEEIYTKLPHRYFEEDQIHAFLISMEKDAGYCMEELERFLPFVDNWATCDQMSPKVFRDDKKRLLKHIKLWLRSKKTYTIRFGIGMLMEHFLDGDFDTEYMKMVAGVKSDEYYVNMMRAWYFATALAKQYDAAVSFLEKKRLDLWTHNKTISKAVESFRVTDDTKGYLKTLRIKA